MEISAQLNPDTLATLLLCATLGSQKGRIKPLNLRQYNRIASWLRQEKLRPGDLLRQEGIKQFVHTSNLDEVETAQQLLQRGALLAIMMEKWMQQGIWVMGRGESRYPQRLKNQLGHAAPPLLFGVGPASLLYRGGLAVVGSREIDHESQQFTRQLASLCVQEGVQILSGGAIGVDLEAMQTALASGGSVVGVLPDNLIKESRSRKYLHYIQEGKLTLVSPYHPDANFSIGNAMGRNRLIYVLAEWAMAVHASTMGSGGTWQGASDNLKKGWVPLMVRDTHPLPDGNKALIDLGGKPLGTLLFQDNFSLRNWISTFVANPGLKTETTTKIITTPTTPEPPPVAETNTNPTQDFWHSAVWPHLQNLLQTETNAKQLAETLQIGTRLATTWLKRAVTENRAIKLNNPVRYIIKNKEKDKDKNQGILHL